MFVLIHLNFIQVQNVGTSHLFFDTHYLNEQMTQKVILSALPGQRSHVSAFSTGIQSTTVCQNIVCLADPLDTIKLR